MSSSSARGGGGGSGNKAPGSAKARWNLMVVEWLKQAAEMMLAARGCGAQEGGGAAGGGSRERGAEDAAARDARRRRRASTGSARESRRDMFDIDIDPVSDIRQRCDKWESHFTPLMIDIVLARPQPHRPGESPFILVERWQLGYFAPVRDTAASSSSSSSLSSSSLGPNAPPSSSNVQFRIPLFYRHMKTLMRTLYSFARLLPAYQVGRSLLLYSGRENQLQFCAYFAGQTSATSDIQADDSATVPALVSANQAGLNPFRTYYAPQLNTPFGSIGVSVQYQPKLDVDSLRTPKVGGASAEAPVIPQSVIISDYMGAAAASQQEQQHDPQQQSAADQKLPGEPSATNPAAAVAAAAAAHYRIRQEQEQQQVATGTPPKPPGTAQQPTAQEETPPPALPAGRQRSASAGAFDQLDPYHQQLYAHYTGAEPSDAAAGVARPEQPYPVAAPPMAHLTPPGTGPARAVSQEEKNAGFHNQSSPQPHNALDLMAGQGGASAVTTSTPPQQQQQQQPSQQPTWEQQQLLLQQHHQQQQQALLQQQQQQQQQLQHMQAQAQATSGTPDDPLPATPDELTATRQRRHTLSGQPVAGHSRVVSKSVDSASGMQYMPQYLATYYRYAGVASPQNYGWFGIAGTPPSAKAKTVGAQQQQQPHEQGEVSPSSSRTASAETSPAGGPVIATPPFVTGGVSLAAAANAAQAQAHAQAQAQAQAQAHAQAHAQAQLHAGAIPVPGSASTSVPAWMAQSPGSGGAGTGPGGPCGSMPEIGAAGGGGMLLPPAYMSSSPPFHPSSVSLMSTSPQMLGGVIPAPAVALGSGASTALISASNSAHQHGRSLSAAQADTMSAAAAAAAAAGGGAHLGLVDLPESPFDATSASTTQQRRRSRRHERRVSRGSTISTSSGRSTSSSALARLRDEDDDEDNVTDDDAVEGDMDDEVEDEMGDAMAGVFEMDGDGSATAGPVLNTSTDSTRAPGILERRGVGQRRYSSPAQYGRGISNSSSSSSNNNMASAGGGVQTGLTPPLGTGPFVAATNLPAQGQTQPPAPSAAAPPPFVDPSHAWIAGSLVFSHRESPSNPGTRKAAAAGAATTASLTATAAAATSTGGGASNDSAGGSGWSEGVSLLAHQLQSAPSLSFTAGATGQPRGGSGLHTSFMRQQQWQQQQQQQQQLEAIAASSADVHSGGRPSPGGAAGEGGGAAATATTAGVGMAADGRTSHVQAVLQQYSTQITTMDEELRAYTHFDAVPGSQRSST